MKRIIRDVSVLLLVGLAPMPRAAVALSTGFIENRGQLDAGLNYYAPAEAASVYFTPDAVVLDMKERLEGQARPEGSMHRFGAAAIDTTLVESRRSRGCAVYIRFEGANPHPWIEARGELVTRYNYFLGKDPAKWRSNVPAYSEVVYHDLWPGIDLVYREEHGNLTYEVVASPGADVGAVRFRYEGADRVVPGEDGSQVIETSAGSLVDLRSSSDMSRGRLLLAREGSQGPGAPAGDKDNPSALLWSTFLGGSAYESGYPGMALDSSGNAVVTGHTVSSDFPTTPGAYDSTYNGGDADVFVAKVASTGSALLWSTFLGGSLDDYGCSLALDPSGNAVVTGQTRSSDFPTTPGAYDQTYNSNYEAFVAKVSSTGAALLWSTFLGGGRNDAGSFLALDTSGNAVVLGSTNSGNFPTTPGAYQQTLRGLTDNFVAALSSTGSTLLWSTFLGGTGNDYPWGLALDPSGNAVVTGETSSSNFPTTPGAYDQTYNLGGDVFVAKLSSTGSVLLWSTFLGGAGEETGIGLALDLSGDAVVTGWTYSSDFPTTPGAYDETWNGGDFHAFVAKVSSTGAALLWSTFLGGSATDLCFFCDLDPSGNVVVTGQTTSSDFPTTPGAYDQSFNGDYDGFVAKVSSTGATLLWSTFLGGSAVDYTETVALDPSGNAVVMGSTGSSDFPTTPGAYDQSFNGDYDGFVVKLGEMATDVASGSSGPRFAGLWTALPNPFCQATEIRYSLNQEAEVDLAVFDVTGRRVTTLARGLMPSGDHRVSWDGQDERGGRVESGIYFVRCETGGSTYYSRIVRVR